LGCRLNQIESEAAAEAFSGDGFMPDLSQISSETAEDAAVPLCIINTCTVTGKAEQKARRLIRLALRKYPRSAVLVTGCYAQLRADEIAAIDGRISVLGGQIKSRIADVPQLLSECLAAAEWEPESFASLLTSRISSPAQRRPGIPENSFRLAATSFAAHSRASLKIQDGCNSSCSYCAIHAARGKSTSLDVVSAVERVRELEAAGNVEVVLTSVNIAQYRGAYDGGTIGFSGLLRILLDSTERIKFRISSIYPEVVDDEFCSVIADGRVRPHFHISVQSGSDSVLDAMNRTYRASDVSLACGKLAAAKERPFLACDIITGFPGETEEDFRRTMELCRDSGFVWVHAFPFSARPGTPAALMRNRIPQSVAGRRAAELSVLSVRKKTEYIESFIGIPLDAVLENVRRPSVLAGDKFVCHAVTENFIHCEITASAPAAFSSGHGVAVRVVIRRVLEDRIAKGGEIEAVAEFCH